MSSCAVVSVALMAPKKTTKSEPTAIVKVGSVKAEKDYLLKRPAGHGGIKAIDLSEGGGMGQNGAQAVMDQCKKLAKLGNAQPLTVYRATKSWSAKREFAAKLAVDPSASFLSIEETHTVADNTRHQY